MSEYRQRPHDHLVEPLFEGLDAQADERPQRKFPWLFAALVGGIAAVWAWSQFS